MARRELDITITDEGRDKGKTFRITEMSASQAERWAVRAFLALARSGVELPEEAHGAGMAGIAALGLQALSRVQFSEAEALMAEMFSCVMFVPKHAAGAELMPRRLIEEDIEEVTTRAKLRVEVLQLHTGFSLAAALSKFRSAAAPAKRSRNTRTSRAQSAASRTTPRALP